MFQFRIEATLNSELLFMKVINKDKALNRIWFWRYDTLFANNYFASDNITKTF